ncbi:MAG: YajQ family cyclic di-GMP-binding protein [Balneolaceae bacterium]
MPSFDIVNQVDAQEVDNAVNNTKKEVSTRYDFKGLHTEINYDRQANTLDLTAAESMKMRAVREMLIKHFVKRGLSPKIMEIGKEEGSSQGSVKVKVILKEGIERETAKKIVKEIKGTKTKVQAAIQEDQVRVTGKKIDDLQEVIQHLKNKDFGIPLQFINMRS